MNVQTISNSNPNFGMKFRLSEETKKILAQNSGKSIKEMKTQHLNIREDNIVRYKKGDLIIPRNVYLQQGRFINKKDVEKTINNWGETPFTKFKNWIKGIFKK